MNINLKYNIDCYNQQSEKKYTYNQYMKHFNASSLVKENNDELSRATDI